MVARRPHRGRLEVRPGGSRSVPQAGGTRGCRRLRERAVFRRGSRDVAPRLRRRLRVQRGRYARRQPVVTRAADVSRLRDHPRQRRLARPHRRHRPCAPACACHRYSEWRPQRRPQRRPGRGYRRDRGLHRRRYTCGSRLVDLPRSAVPDARRRRLRRTERRAFRRFADRAVHRACARRADARAARRPHRRARARLQHGVPPRGAPRNRRLQPGLSARWRRCGRVLAAAGARLEDRLRVRRRSSGITIDRR